MSSSCPGTYPRIIPPTTTRMAKFRAPSSSLASSTVSVAPARNVRSQEAVLQQPRPSGRTECCAKPVPRSTDGDTELDPSTPKPHQNPLRRSARLQRSHVTSRRAPAAHRLKKVKVAVKDAARRHKRTKQWAEPSIAYVGNIGPEVDEEALRSYFSRYGPILSARIHCCGGVAMTVKPPPASYHQNMKVSQYGIIVFATKIARHEACKNGGILAGRELTVSVAISDLPEVREKIGKRLDDYMSRLEPPDVHRAQKSALRSLKIEPTVLLDPEHEKNKRKLRNPFKAMGISFQGAIM